MRRLTVLFGAALLAAAIASPPASTVVGHSASGTGTSDQSGGTSFNFSATGGPGATGGGATGSMTYQQNQGNDVVQAQVRCLFVSGNRAQVVGLIVASTFPPPDARSVGNYMFFYVEDNGTPGAGVDEWSAFFGGGGVSTETSCTQFVDLANPILTGEIVVSAVTAPACPPGDDDDGDDDGLTDDRETLFGALSGDSDSDDDGVSDGNEDSDEDGEDDEDEDDDENNGCPDEDSDGDGEDDEDEDDEEDDD